MRANRVIDERIVVEAKVIRDLGVTRHGFPVLLCELQFKHQLGFDNSPVQSVVVNRGNEANIECLVENILTLDDPNCDQMLELCNSSPNITVQNQRKLAEMVNTGVTLRPSENPPSKKGRPKVSKWRSKRA